MAGDAQSHVRRSASAVAGKRKSHVLRQKILTKCPQTQPIGMYSSTASAALQPMKETTQGSLRITVEVVTTNAHDRRRSSCCLNPFRLTTASHRPRIITGPRKRIQSIRAPPPSHLVDSPRVHGLERSWELAVKAHCSPQWYRRTGPQPSPLPNLLLSLKILYQRKMLWQLTALELE